LNEIFRTDSDYNAYYIYQKCARIKGAFVVGLQNFEIRVTGGVRGRFGYSWAYIPSLVFLAFIQTSCSLKRQF